MVPDSLSSLTKRIQGGLGERDARTAIENLFGSRYQKRHYEPSMVRDAFMLRGSEEGPSGIPWAGLIHEDNPPSGRYGGASVVWFPTDDAGSLITLVVGTQGISPDEGILTRPGHRRRVVALRRYLARLGIDAWTKPDPASLTTSVPLGVQRQFDGFEDTFRRYGSVIYCMAKVPTDPALARQVVQAFFDLYAFERGWQVLAQCQLEFTEYIDALRSELFQIPTAASVNELLRLRHFVVLEGPPGTGKTRMALDIRKHYFDSHGSVVQFHPAVTYEDFMVGLSPDPRENSLRFKVRPGWLLEAARSASEAPFLLVIDEINRADLGKILGEAIYLFESGDDEFGEQRVVQLPHPVGGQVDFSIPSNLHVIGTMNTADRSIANIDLAVRRRFSFVSMPPDRSVVVDQHIPLATEVFDRLVDVFVEHAPFDALDLLPGHAYFLASDEAHLRVRFKHDLLPLLNEYLREGYLGPASTELYAVRDELEDVVG